VAKKVIMNYFSVFYKIIGTEVVTQVGWDKAKTTARVEFRMKSGKG
jgi:hypothetical protein